MSHQSHRFHPTAGRRVNMNDALLTTPTPAELAAWQEQTGRMAGLDPGRLWTGIFQPVLDAMPPAFRSEVMKQLDAYRAQLPGSPASTADASLREVAGGINRIRSLNDAARKRWGQDAAR
jgi:hypothetical protein